MSYIYLASPYTDDDKDVREHRYLEAMWALYWLNGKNIAVYSPIVHWHPVQEVLSLDLDADYWEARSTALLVPAHTLTILQLDGWDESVGVAGELRFAEMTGKPVNYMKRSLIERGQYVISSRA